MQAIYKSGLTNNSQSTVNFSIVPDTAFFAGMPGNVLKVYIYATKRQGIPGWKFNRTDIARQTQLSESTVKRALKWLVDHGWAEYRRLQHRFTQWCFFSTPNPTAPSPGIFIQGQSDPFIQGQSDPVLYKENFKEKKTTTAVHGPIQVIQEPEPEQRNNVVVVSDSDKLNFPAQLDKAQLKNAKHTIKKAPVDQQQAILTCLAYALTAGTVKNPCAYLAGLVKSAVNGTFIPKNNDIDANNRASMPAGGLANRIWTGYPAIKPTEQSAAKGFIGNLRGALNGR